MYIKAQEIRASYVFFVNAYLNAFVNPSIDERHVWKVHDFNRTMTRIEIFPESHVRYMMYLFLHLGLGNVGNSNKGLTHCSWRYFQEEKWNNQSNGWIRRR